MADTSWNSVSLLLPFEGADGATSATDYSPKVKTATFAGTAQLDTAQKVFGVSSLLLGGARDYVEVTGSSAFDIETEDLTAECWIRLASGETGGIVLNNRGSFGTLYANWALSVTTSKKLELYFADQTTAAPGTVCGVITGATTLSNEVWYHVAAVKSGLSIFVFLDGAVDGTATLSGNPKAGASNMVSPGC